MSINKTISLIEVNKLNEKIKNESALYFYRSTPFTEHGEYNYNGLLKENFFFEKLFSEKGKCTDYLDDIYNSIFKRVKKSVMLIGNPGCGKTTFVNYLKRKLINKHPNTFFKIFDFDKNTSNPTLDEYIEILSSYLLDLLCNDINNNNNNVNKVFYNLFRSNEKLILEKINAENNIKNFFIDFNIRFIQCSTKASTRYDFINNINRLFFNQILSLIVLWHISEIKLKDSVHKIVFCFDNLDVLVNSEIINGFFDNYFLFVRNIDSILQNLNDPYIRKNQFAYSDIFTFIFSCRQHTWAKFQQSCIHGNNIIKLSSLVLDITDAFNNNAILNKREEYIIGNRNIFNGFLDNASDTKSLLEDMHDWHNIYDLFDDDYRQCSITFEELLNENEQLLSEYKYVKNRLPANSLYGARGIVFKALFEKFKNEDLFKAIGVLDIDSTDSPLSTARIILNYLNNYTFQEKSNSIKNSVSFEKLVTDFSGILDKDEINNSLIQMFNLGINSSWNELVAFVQINSDDFEDCKSTKIFITKAGHEYLDLISTHFEFFNTRVTKRKSYSGALFSIGGIDKYVGDGLFTYNFEETIKNVIEIVENCCENMSEFYVEKMFPRFKGKNNYLNSHFVYKTGRTKVFHCERIIHTHIRYIDHYRLYLLRNNCFGNECSEINRILITFIEDYIKIGQKYSDILSAKSYEELFPIFNEQIQKIKNSEYSDFESRIDVPYT